MEYINKTKVLVTIFLGALSSWLGILFMPVILMVTSNVTDYATGLMASAARNEEISSYKSIRGIIKKVGMWVLVFIGWMMDMIIDYSVNTVGLQFNIQGLAGFTWPCAVSCIVAIWVVINEIISIKENIKAMGTEVPAFVDKITDGMLDAVDKKILESYKDSESNHKKDED